MMEDKMKKFIEDNHDEFDFELPSEETWNKIAEELPVQEQPNRFKWVLQIAAAVILLLGAGVILKTMNNSGQETIAENTEVSESQIQVAALGDFSTDMAEVEQYYITQVNQHQKELVDFQVDEDLMLEVELLKEEYEELKLEMGQAVDPRKVVEAMIENYEMRLEILKDILEAMKEEKSINSKHQGDGEII